MSQRGSEFRRTKSRSLSKAKKAQASGSDLRRERRRQGEGNGGDSVKGRAKYCSGPCPTRLKDGVRLVNALAGVDHVRHACRTSVGVRHRLTRIFPLIRRVGASEVDINGLFAEIAFPQPIGHKADEVIAVCAGENKLFYVFSAFLIILSYFTDQIEEKC
ncbi:hypothetical protein K1719_039487 [Acacia pycnantha]|nr:hypothetical protein K1719_039487 [Acacia pycnantha]